MAGLEFRGASYNVIVRFGGRRFVRSLRTCNETEAISRKLRIEENIKLIESGRLIFPDEADVMTFLMSDGKLAKKLKIEATLIVTQEDLFREFFNALPEGSLEATTCNLLKIHRRHFEREIGKRLPIRDFSQSDLQKYYPLVITLAETQEVLYLHNRSGNRPSLEHSSLYFDLAIKQCKKAGFRKIVLRGDNDFSSTEHLDRWDKQGVKFILGFDARPNLCRIAENLPKTAWKRLDRSKESFAPEKERSKHPNVKEPIVVANGYENQKLRAESYAEFDYRPTACGKPYRMVVVCKEIDVTSGQMFLFDKDKYFFYITNEDQGEVPGRGVIRGAKRRCNQENTISQLKACGALSAPLNDLESNGAYMLFASLALTLKLWSGMMIRVTGNANQKQVRRDARNRIIRMEYWIFLNSLLLLPAQIVRSARTRIFRLLTYRPRVDLPFTIHDHIQLPLRC
jgi:hypothetical protein